MSCLNQVLIEGVIARASFASDSAHVLMHVGEKTGGLRIMARLSPVFPRDELFPGRRIRIVGSLQKDGGLFIMAEHVDLGPEEETEDGGDAA